MNADVPVDDATLMAYADGELDPAGRQAVEAAMAADPKIAARIAEHAALRTRLRSAFDPVLQEPVPGRLLEQLRHAPVERSPATVTVLGERRAKTQKVRRNWSWPEWGSLAASLAVGVLAGQMFSRSSEPLVARNGELYAQGVLAAALSGQLGSTQSDSAPVQVAVSFRNRAGNYCRTFQMAVDASLAGLACREEAGWRLRMLTEAVASPVPKDNYRQAATALPPAILNAVEQDIDGEPLDAEGEAAARNSDWR